MKEKVSVTIEKSVISDLDKLIDHINIKNRSHAVEYLIRKALGENKTAVILSGGDPELLRVSKFEFRPTVNIKGNYLIELQLRKLKENNFNNVFIIGRKEVLSAIFDIVKSGEDYGIKANYIEEKKSNGTAESLRLLKGRINNTFLVVFCDILFDKINIKELWETHIRHNYIATLILTTSSQPKKGIVKLEGTKALDFTQAPKGADMFIGFSSMFVAEPKIFDFEGKSFESDIFPRIAAMGLLGGHVSSEKEVHIHSKQDIENLRR